MSGFNPFFDSFGLGSDFFAVFIAVYFAVWLLAIGYSMLVYILYSLGLYTIANRRGIHHPWMAWLPLVNVWILGSISDQYQYVAKGQVKNRRKTMLGLNIAIVALLLVILGAAVALIITGVSSGFYMDMAESAMIVPGIILAVAYVALMVIAIILTVFQYVCLYDLFSSCNPNNAVTFLVLTIFFNFLLPYFVFACRKKDLGMPPRKTQAPIVPWQPAPAPQQPVWQNVVQLPEETPAAEEPAEEASAEEAPAEEPTEE